MKRLPLLALLASSMLLTACASTNNKEVLKRKPGKQFDEPLLVGIPIETRVATSAKRIGEQMQLLEAVEAQKYVGTYKVVQHNNGMDARKGSPNTLPQAYAYSPDLVGEEPLPENKDNFIGRQGAGSWNKIIRRIEWVEDSATDLGRLFAKNLGYRLVVENDLDVLISMKITNETLKEAFERFRDQIKGFASLEVDDENSRIVLRYYELEEKK